MSTAIDAYFQAERAESLVFAAFGIVAISASVYLLWRYGDAMSKGLAIALVLVGLIQITVGGTVYLRTPGQVVALKAQYNQDPGRFKAEETARMSNVMTNFKVYKIIEVGFILVGLAVTLIVGHPFWLGLGMGMLVQGALMLPADITAERRGTIYQSAIAQGV
jgi:hypothetical protein